eukprot:8288018-Alexandrium_andersonii.AAC.1
MASKSGNPRCSAARRRSCGRAHRSQSRAPWPRRGRSPPRSASFSSGRTRRTPPRRCPTASCPWGPLGSAGEPRQRRTPRAARARRLA